MPRIEIELADEEYDWLERVGKGSVSTSIIQIICGLRRAPAGSGSSPVFAPEWIVYLGRMPDRQVAQRIYDVTEPPQHQISDVTTIRNLLGISPWKKHRRRRVFTDKSRAQIWGECKLVGASRTYTIRKLGFPNRNAALTWAQTQGLDDLVSFMEKK